MTMKQKGELALRTRAMPGDTNPAGDIFGGWLMGQMDIVGGIVARQRARGRVVTVAVDGFMFHKPVHVGDVVCCYTDLLDIGRTFIKFLTQARILHKRQTGRRVKVTEGIFTFVAIDEDHQKRPVPPDVN